MIRVRRFLNHLELVLLRIIGLGNCGLAQAFPLLLRLSFTSYVQIGKDSLCQGLCQLLLLRLNHRWMLERFIFGLVPGAVLVLQ